MKRSLEEKIHIPKYSLAEELMNAISHGVGALLAIGALVICIVVSVMHNNIWGVVSSSIYGATMIILYCMSTIYHSLKINKAKRVFRIIDHCSIFLLIAGTYTPFTLVSIRNDGGWVLFGIVWGAAILGIVLNAIDLEKFDKLSLVCYLVMGWAIIFAIKPLVHALPRNCIVFLIVGGVAYSLGAILYAIGARVKYMHSIFHLFCLAGSIFHFFAIALYVL